MATGFQILISAFVFLFFSLSTIKAQSDRPYTLSIITPKILSITITSPELNYGRLTRHLVKPNDKTEIDKQGNTWLLRNGNKVGTLVGNERKFLYHFGHSTGGHSALSKGYDTNDFALTSTNDPNYQIHVPPEQIGRKSRPVDSVWSAEGLAVAVEHTFYLFFEEPLTEDEHYILEVPSFIHQELISFTYAPQDYPSSAIHLSQLGFAPDSQAKSAYLSLWAGDAGSHSFPRNLRFHIFDQSSNTEVFSGTSQLKKPALAIDEDAYGINYTGADVHSVTFNSVTTPGTYYLVIEGVGRSHSFTIADTIWEEPLYHGLRIFYHQRNGIALAPPYTDFIRPDSTEPDAPILKSGARLMDTGNGFIEGLDNFSTLLAEKTDKPFPITPGGYFDAGDWDSRIQHLLVARTLADLYEQFPRFYNALILNIPESFNQTPDILDEAMWALDFYSKLQEDDGSVRGGIEASDHPHFGEPSWLESHQRYVYHPGLWSTYLFAATSAQICSVIETIDPEKAQLYRTNALRAMGAAEALLEEDPQQPIEIHDARNLAAASLFRLTGAPSWHDIFTETSAFSSMMDRAPLTLLYRDNEYNQADAAWLYLITDHPEKDFELHDRIRKALISTADYLITAQSNAGYSWLKDPWRPPFAGAFTVPFSRDLIRAALLTGEEKYYTAVEQAIHVAHGSNPLNLSYTTYLGIKRVVNPHYPDARITRQTPPPGITVLGPAEMSFLGDFAQSLLENYGEYCYPELDRWPVLESFLDVYWVPIMNEFSIETLAQQAYTWGFLAAFKSD